MPYLGQTGIMEIFAQRLKELRKEKSLTQDELSKATGIGRPCISRWELNQTIVNGEQLIILARFFGVSTDYLLGLVD